MRTSNAATNEPFCTSACRITRPLWMIGELANPHCASGTMKKPESRRPKSFFHNTSPLNEYAYKPSEPNIAMMWRPSVASVELACVDFGCRLMIGTPVVAVRSQRALPVRLSKHETIHLCSV